MSRIWYTEAHGRLTADPAHTEQMEDNEAIDVLKSLLRRFEPDLPETDRNPITLAEKNAEPVTPGEIRVKAYWDSASVILEYASERLR